MNITFVLPKNNNTPVGGYKIAFQYANFLNTRGHNVTVVFRIGQRSVLGRLKHAMKISFLLHDTNINWFELNDKIKTRNFDDIELHKYTTKDTIVIATHWSTALPVHNLKLPFSYKFYFIQDFETFDPMAEKGQVEATYGLDLNIVTISNGLKKNIQQYIPNKKIQIVENFFLKNQFFVEKPIKKREQTISMLIHSRSTKRTEFGLEIIDILKQQFPKMKVILFGGMIPENIKIPDYALFYKNANVEQLRKEIYGNSQVYLMPTKQEGWGLTGMEAMASGTVVVAGEIAGIKEYILPTDGILVDVTKKQAYVDAVSRLFQNNSERILRAEKGVECIQRFSIEQSGRKFEQILRNNYSNND
ncbi:glycosyltransferase family 4 protein [Leuconostoc gasicomitatum]|uniref:glycosyltransferase family 4 protein n=1 Tax=Leuconostoc gasicomitatum TaxID=115778 RepID=UPI0007448DC6|nr:glycosyltransferase family 4 protein [Leuconostoc gasicomitatum]CUR63290.1 Glycosyltransferase [Leuconostoc gasicomitatum KG16-1]